MHYADGCVATSMKDKRAPVAVYAHAASVLAKVDQGSGGVRTTLYQHAMPDSLRPTVLALVSETMRHKETLEAALEAEATLLGSFAADRWMIMVLTYELVINGGRIKGGAKSAVVQAVGEQKATLSTLVEKVLPDVGGTVAKPSEKQRLPRYVRVNTLKTSVEAVLSHLERVDGLSAAAETAKTMWRDGAVLPDPLLPSLLVLPPGTNLHGHPLVERGEVVLQDRASCLPAWALSPPPGAKVIDACAAPGNKTTQLACLVTASGEVCAFERNAQRFATLRRQVGRAGATHVRCCLADFLAAEPAQHAGFTHALCDPSCSGSGGAGGHHHGGETEQQYAERLRALAALQFAIVTKAMSMPDMRCVVYSTCSIHREENEDVVEAVLKEKAAHGWRLVRALPSWPTRGLAEAASGAMCVRASVDDATHGFFVARFERGGGDGGGASGITPQAPTKNAPKAKAKLARREQEAAVAASQPPQKKRKKETGQQEKPAAAKAAAPLPPAPRSTPLSPEEEALERKREKRRRKDENRKKRKLAKGGS